MHVKHVENMISTLSHLHLNNIFNLLWIAEINIKYVNNKHFSSFKNFETKNSLFIVINRWLSTEIFIISYNTEDVFFISYINQAMEQKNLTEVHHE